MRIGISSNAVVRFGAERYERLRTYCFHAVDLNMMSRALPFYTCTEEELPALVAAEKALAEKNGIAFFQTHGPWPHPTKDSNEEERAVTLAYMCRAIRATALLGSKYMVVHPLFPFGTHEPEGVGEQTFEINANFWRALMPTAKEYGVTVCLENMPFRHYSHSLPADILKIVHAVNDEHFAICLDTGHVNVFPEADIYAQMQLIKDKLRVVHIHDNDGKGDLHQLPYFGKLDWAAFGRAWRDIGFDGVFSFECKPPLALPDALYEKTLSLMPEMAREIVKK
jgi:sugar phosphate isomerase/epimerase